MITRNDQMWPGQAVKGSSINLTLFDDEPVQTADSSKALGAYYTDTQIAEFLAWWALRKPSDTAMDPSFGGGVFIKAACKRLVQLDGCPANQVLGVEIDPEVHERSVAELTRGFGVRRQNLHLANFFNIDVKSIPAVNAVIGNPPFVRYQRFAGKSRKLALARSLEHGVRLPQLCSSWAPFLIHSIAMLRSGGRLAMVLPMEVAYAKYARPVLDFIHRSFETATFLTFRAKLFPDLSEQTVLLLAENRGTSPAQLLLRDFAHPSCLSEVHRAEALPIRGTRKLDAVPIATGKSRLIEYLIPDRARKLYRDLSSLPSIRRLGAIADVGIGYVTGSNDFFHLDQEEARRRAIPTQFLKSVVRRGKAFSGLRFTSTDWDRAADAGDAALLLHIEKNEPVPEAIRRYLEIGEARGVSATYKCRTRSPWFSVPHVHYPDAFLTYMSGLMPQLVANDAKAYAPNTLHVLRMKADSPIPSFVLAALWHTSITKLSVEIEGHALGGGMLKLEPTEARQVLIALPQECGQTPLVELALELDELIRKGRGDVAEARADQVVLRQFLGLSETDCKVLKSAATTLRARRGYGKS